jgi:hypothetical protein
MKFSTASQATKATKLSYIGGVSQSAKIAKNEKMDVLTYCIYLAPSKLSGYNVCAGATAECIAACLHESGHNKIDTKGVITNARIKKTQMFFEDRQFFMQWVIAEITKYQKLAEKKGMGFSVRLNGTSDLSPLIFKLDGKCILDIFPDVQFYDYTKILNRSRVAAQYSNYDLTFSYSGHNWSECMEALNAGIRVAVVFEEVPEYFEGIKVVNGDESDLRYLDAGSVIVGLKFKKVKNKIDTANSAFIIPKGNAGCVYLQHAA